MDRRWLVPIFIILILTACNLPDTRTTDTPASPSPQVGASTQAFATPTVIPIETLLARATPTRLPVATSTPRRALASPLSGPVNCRFGPGTAYAVVGALNAGGQAEIVGRNSDFTWWQVRNPSDPSTVCWLAASVINATGNIDALPVADAPLAQVPDFMNVACNAFPQFVVANAEITANGPTTVTWRWETSEGEQINADSLLFLEAGSQGVFVSYRVNVAKDYWIQVRILSPNNATGQANFKATCVP
jgi:uncharacterized protein YraI